MNTFFASAGRAAANVVDGSFDITRKIMTGTGYAGTSFVAGWKSQRSMNARERHRLHGRALKSVQAY